MKKGKKSRTDKRQNDSCHLCGKREDLASKEVCQECVTRTLLKQLPRLKRTLEMKHGAMLDSWLAEGKLVQSNWEVSSDLQVGKDRIKWLLKETVQDAIAREEIALYLPEDEGWKPIEIDHLMDYIYRQCVDELQQFIRGLLIKAVSSAPTEESERELVEVVSGRKRVRHRYVRERAVEALSLSKATPFLLPTKALIEMRYQADKGKELYTEMMEGEISSVWSEVKDSLPEEIVKLISTDSWF
jgi:hypothetical protein